MNYPYPVASRVNADIAAYRRIRGVLPRLAAGLSDEDLLAQSMLTTSPGKWHLGHVSWFFETMILARQPGYQRIDERLNEVFNSYYEALGKRIPRGERGLMTRPSVAEIMAYRAEVDVRMEQRLADGLEAGEETYLFRLGLNHEQQHQELFLMDLTHLMSCNPLNPAVFDHHPHHTSPEPRRSGWVSCPGGLVKIGAEDDPFAFDNEMPRHRVWLEPYKLGAGLVTNGQYLHFVEDGGYQRPELWLSDGWAQVQAENWQAPLYWRMTSQGWSQFGLTGEVPIDPDAAVCHVSYYEADAYARWAGHRLPTEAEWEAAARFRHFSFSGLMSEVWQWTASPYVPYPGFKPTSGTASEYNGKFMANQMVLRGSSWATPTDHGRISYRNFYYPNDRWMYGGIRLATDVKTTESHDEFRCEMREGLSKSPKSLSPKWLYDAEGSRLFEDITRLDDYYPTRQEAALLHQVIPHWSPRFGPGAILLELGSGASEKTRIVLDAAPDLAIYAPLDISPTALDDAAQRICADYPNLVVRPILADFLNLPELPEDLGEGCRIGFFPGSTIGNLNQNEARRLLSDMGERLGPGSLFILGVDLIKSGDILMRAYDDTEGVTAAFNCNLLVRANRELGMDFDVDAFAHEARWNAEESRVEMHLVAVKPQTVHLDEDAFLFEEGESLHTESSRKFDEISLRTLVETAGWKLEAFEVGPEPSVALALLSR